jgi:hypothetical protein
MESQNMESGLPIRESRWQRPKLYWTIAGLYLIISFAIMISLSVWYLYTNSPYCEGDGIGTCLAWIFYPLSILILIIFGIPTIIGTIRLLSTSENGYMPSIIALLLCSAFHFIFGFVSVPVRMTLYPTIFGAFLFGLDVLMIVFVAMGWKKMFWKSFINNS